MFIVPPLLRSGTLVTPVINANWSIIKNFLPIIYDFSLFKHILSVQSLTPSMKSFKRDSVTSASTIAEEEDPISLIKKRRHSDISRNLFMIGRSHEWPERIPSFSGSHLLERTNSSSSIRLSLYKESIKRNRKRKVSKVNLDWIFPRTKWSQSYWWGGRGQFYQQIWWKRNNWRGRTHFRDTIIFNELRPKEEKVWN